MQTLMLAARNLFRNTRRTVITLGAIIVGLGLMLFVVNFQHGSYDAMIDAVEPGIAGRTVYLDLNGNEMLDDLGPFTAPSSSTTLPIISHHHEPMNRESAIVTRVGNGRLAPSPSNRVAKVGMTFHRMTHTTPIAITITAVG